MTHARAFGRFAAVTRCLTILSVMAPLVAAQRPDRVELARRQTPPAIDITTGCEIPSEGYCDQPYVVKLDDGTWLCTMTTGAGHEGQAGQHVVACRSDDRGATWGDLVPIEPADGPEASWVMPYLTPYGRVYAFYTYNAANLREVAGGGRRVDTLGEYAFKYSDDGGRTWSERRWFIPIRATEIDRGNPYGGDVRFFWGVGKPLRHDGVMTLGFAKIGKFGRGFIETSESWFLRCTNIDTERDPERLAWTLLPDGERGLTSPRGSIAEEANLTRLSDGSLFATYRTVEGHPCHAYSRDGGHSWTPPAYMTYGPGGALIDHPRAANFVRRLDEGPYAGRYLYWFHDHGGRSYEGRNPAYLLGGVEVEGPDGMEIQWGEAVAVLYHPDPNVRISYPDFLWDDGLYVTETQKSVARVHRIPDDLLAKVFARPRPNVVLICIDDLNDWVGALGGHPQAHTPNIDALAACGVLFTNAHCQAPVCTPSRASLFTGKLPSTTGLYFLQPALAAVEELRDIPMLTGRFAEAGYATMGVGKLYHGGGEARYFQEYGGGKGGFGPSAPEKLSYPAGHPLWDWGPYPANDADMPDAKVADWASAKLGEARDGPFFLAVGFWRPHVPMCVPQPWFDRIGTEADVQLPVTRAEDRDDLPLYARELTIGLPAPRHEWMVEHDAWRGAVHAYLASSAFVDAQVGQVLRALHEGPHAGNTIVVLLSDHGFHLGEKQRWAKRSLWEESTRVPLIIAGPGIAAARRDAAVGLVDVFPTLLELCGLASDATLDGNSLAPLLEQDAPDWPHAAVTTFGPGNHSVRTHRWRYIRYADGSEELYDHGADQHEFDNLAGRPELDAELTSLRALVPEVSANPVPRTSGAGLDAMRAADAKTGVARQ